MAPKGPKVDPLPNNGTLKVLLKKKWERAPPPTQLPPCVFYTTANLHRPTLLVLLPMQVYWNGSPEAPTDSADYELAAIHYDLNEETGVAVCTLNEPDRLNALTWATSHHSFTPHQPCCSPHPPNPLITTTTTCTRLRVQDRRFLVYDSAILSVRLLAI